MELEYNDKTVVIGLNCKKLRCTSSVLRNTEVHDELNELTLDIN
jgi:hypothetical protein